MKTSREAVLLAGMFLVAGGVFSGSGLAQQAGVEDRYFEADGVRLRYTDRGSGPPVVLIHGFSLESDANWRSNGIEPSLASDFRVIALDLRGHGASEKPHDPGAYGAEFAEDVLRLLDHLEIERAHLVGYSMGGAVSLQVLTAHPERVRSAVLGGYGWQPPGSEEGKLLGLWLAELERVAEEGGSVTDVIMLPHWPEASPALRATLDANDPLALAAVLRGMGGLAVSEETLASSEVPTLVVIGEDDMFRPGAEALVAVKPDSQLVVLPRQNHATALGDPGLGEAIRTFLEAQR